jgi:hypothetical protein
LTRFWTGEIIEKRRDEQGRPTAQGQRMKLKKNILKIAFGYSVLKKLVVENTLKVPGGVI